MKKANIVQRIKNDARTVATWGKMRGHNPYTVHALLSGRIRPGTRTYIAITNDLKADGYMTPEDEE